MTPPTEWTPFTSTREKIDFLKRIGLIPQSYDRLKVFAYSGGCGNAPAACTVEGYVDEIMLVICLDGGLHCIHKDLFKEMQSAGSVFPNDYVVIDVETTGFSPNRDYIIEIAAARYHIDECTDTFTTLVAPPCDIPAIITALTGITNEEACAASGEEEALARFKEFAGELPLVAHNAPFDLGFLTAACKRYGWSVDNAVFDTLKLSRKAFAGLDSYRLEFLCECLQIRTKCFHRALPDVEATAILFQKCREEMNNLAELPGRPTKKGFRPTDIKPKVSSFDSGHPFFGKSIVFTGELGIARATAAQIAANLGATVRGSVSKKTDFLVVGKQELHKVGSDGLSDKEEKAYQINKDGTGCISIITEKEFLALTAQTSAKGAL